MYQIEIDRSLRCYLFSSDDKKIEDRTNMIYVPGFGSIGKTRVEIVERVIQTQPDTNIVTFLYKSHQGNALDGLERDIDDLGKVVHELEKFGLSKDSIGFLGVCYGSYLTAQHLSEEKGYRYALMVEPFLGMESLKPYAKLVFRLGNILSGFGISKVPVGKRHNHEKAYANTRSVINVLSKEVPLIQGTPLLALATDYHKFLNRDYIEDWVNGSGGSFKLIKERNRLAVINSITHNITGFKETCK